MKTKQEKQKDREKASEYLQTCPASGYFRDTLRNTFGADQHHAMLYNHLRIDVDALNRKVRKDSWGGFSLYSFLTGAVF
jgi:arylamine N-acetyltransferase